MAVDNSNSNHNQYNPKVLYADEDAQSHLLAVPVVLDLTSNKDGSVTIC